MMICALSYNWFGNVCFSGGLQQQGTICSRQVDVIMIIYQSLIKKLMKEKALRKHSLHEKTAASVLLKLFISSNE